MTTVLTAYVVYASAILIWCSCLASDVPIHYVAISSGFLKEWLARQSGVIVIELHTNRTSPEAKRGIPGALVVNTRELKTLVRWLPPASTVAICDCEGLRRLGESVEQALAEASIEYVYWLDAAATQTLCADLQQRRPAA